MRSKFKAGGVFEVRCYDKNGKLKWQVDGKNLVTNEGLDHILDTLFSGSGQVSAWYVGLKNSGSPAAGDTLGSHAGWTENSNYTGDRKEFIESASSGQSVTNSANKASFSINADGQTIAGAFLASVNTGAVGILLCVADFTGGNKSCDNGDTLEVAYTMSAADDGA